MGGLAGTAAKLLASLDLDTKPFERGAKRVDGTLGKMEGRFGKLGSIAARGAARAATSIAAAGAVAIGFLTKQVVSGVRSLEDLERVMNATEGVIESTGGKAGVTATQVRDLAQSLEAVTTADDKVIQSGENLLLTFTGIGKDVFPQATKAMVDMGIAMAQGDVANADFKASAIQIGKALNDPIKGITALRKVGVAFTDDQQKMIKDMVEAGDVMGAQKIILQELEVEFGKAGEAAGKGFGADMRRAQDAIEDAQQALATGFLPLISRASKFIQTELAKPETVERIRRLGDSLAGAFDQLIGIGKNLPWQQIGDSFKLMGQGAKAALDLFTSMPTWVQTAVLTGWGLNKLTGGALGTIVGELGKGLIKGVLGMNAGVVNARAGVVNVVGGTGAAGAGAAGAAAGAGRAGGALKLLGGLTGVGFAAILANEFEDEITGFATDLRRQLVGENFPTFSPKDLEWPFGPKNAPEWAGGTLPGVVSGTHQRPGPDKAPVPGGDVNRPLTGSVFRSEQAKAAVNWKKISAATDKSNAKLDVQRQRLESVRGAVTAAKAAVDTSRSAIVTGGHSDASRIVSGVASAIRGLPAPIVRVSVTSQTFIRAARQAGTYSASHVGAYNHAGHLID